MSSICTIAPENCIQYTIWLTGSGSEITLIKFTAGKVARQHISTGIVKEDDSSIAYGGSFFASGRIDNKKSQYMWFLNQLG